MSNVPYTDSYLDDLLVRLNIVNICPANATRDTKLALIRDALKNPPSWSHGSICPVVHNVGGDHLVSRRVCDHYHHAYNHHHHHHHPHHPHHQHDHNHHNSKTSYKHSTISNPEVLHALSHRLQHLHGVVVAMQSQASHELLHGGETTVDTHHHTHGAEKVNVSHHLPSARFYRTFEAQMRELDGAVGKIRDVFGAANDHAKVKAKL